MKLNAVAVVSSDFKKTIEFYSLLGFTFPEITQEEDHIEAITSPGSARLMIDSKDLIIKIFGEEPKPANTSAFAIEYDSPTELNAIAEKVTRAGFTIVKEPWDAFWGQRYCVVKDPDGYQVDLYATLPE